MNTKMFQRIGKILLASVFIYIGLSLCLVFWPIQLENNSGSYDFTSIEKAKNSSLGKDLWLSVDEDGKLFNRVYESTSDAVMILIHGSGTDSRYLSDLANQIANDNIATVVTPDIRGHGRNEGEKGFIEYIGQLENDLEYLITYCKQELQAKKVILAGHSSGGGFVLRFIGNPANTKIDQAILLAPYLGYKAETVKPNSGGWVQKALPRIIGLSMLNNIGFSYLNKLPVLFFNRPVNMNDEFQASKYSYSMTLNFAPKDHMEEINRIDIPVLVLVGDKDESFYSEAFINTFKPAAKYVQVELLDDVKHLDIVKGQQAFKFIQAWNEK